MQHLQGQEPPAERGQSRSGSESPATSNNTNSGGSGLQLPPSLSPSAAAPPPLGGQLNSADIGHNGAAVQRGSLQHAVGGSLPPGDGRGHGGGRIGSLDGSGGLSGLDDVTACVSQFQLTEQLGGRVPPAMHMQQMQQATPQQQQQQYPQQHQQQHPQQHQQHQHQHHQHQQHTHHQQQQQAHHQAGNQGHHMVGGGDPRLVSSAAGLLLGSGGYAQLSPPPPLPLHVATGMGPTAFHEQLRYRDAQIAKLAGTLAHYRAWAAQVQARYQMFNAEAARPARRIYVGGLPAGTQELELRQYINDLLIKTGGAAAPGFPINSCKLYPEKNFAFLEFRSVEESSNCMAFDGIAFRDCYLKIRRPNNYEPDVCIMLGPPDPDPTMDLSQLDIVKTVVLDSPNKLFVGGLPCDWTEEQVKDLLLPFGVLKAFNLVMDKNTGNSKGYAFCEYADTALTNYVIQALNGKPVGNKFLTVKRALAPAPGSPFDPQLG